MFKQGNIRCFFPKIEAVLFMVIDLSYEDHLCLWQLCLEQSLFEIVAWIVLQIYQFHYSSRCY